MLTAVVHKKLNYFDLDVEISCMPGSLTALVGPSGAGKTTLIRVIAGLERADQGRVNLNGQTWVDTRKNIFVPPRKRGLGFVFQDYCLFPHLTVRKNVAFAAKRPERVDQILDLFGIRHLEHKKPSRISGGERQRAAFCQALASDPVLLLLDEPFSALDVATREGLRRELKAIKSDLEIPILHVTHDLDEAEFLADDIVPIVDGHADPLWQADRLCTRCDDLKN